jgi:hypothetical protein
MPSAEAVLNSGFWDALPALVWTTVGLVIVWRYRHDIGKLLGDIRFRLRSGAAVKVASFELGASYISPGPAVNLGGSFQTKVDDGRRREQRHQFKDPNRTIQLVHRIAPSSTPGQLYDILIYVVPQSDKMSLVQVQRVEYYFGPFWGDGIFTSIDRARSFSVTTSAYGPFYCTAEIHFNDGEGPATIGRYIDFEMGAWGAVDVRTAASHV